MNKFDPSADQADRDERSVRAFTIYQRAKNLFKPQPQPSEPASTSAPTTSLAPKKTGVEAQKYAPFDRANYCARVSTFTLANWAGVAHSDVLSPLQLARWGWKCTDRNKIQCVGCNQTLDCGPHKGLGWTQARHIAQKLFKQTQSDHVDGCQWQITPSPESFATLPLRSKGSAYAAFSGRLGTWAGAGVREYLHVLEGVAEDVFQDLRPEERRELLKASRQQWSASSGSMEGDVVACALSLSGWEPNGRHLMCSLCRRVYPVSLPNMRRAAKTQAVASSTVDVVNSGDVGGNGEGEEGRKRPRVDGEGGPAAKKAMVQAGSSPLPQLVGSPSSHHSFCPYVLPVQPPTKNPGNRRNLLTENTEPGWKEFRKFVVGHLMAWPAAQSVSVVSGEGGPGSQGVDVGIGDAEDGEEREASVSDVLACVGRLLGSV